ncbi:MAG: xanthine dehydrogenase accessory protein XdhC [Betaproteobacteria bacterium]
MKSWIDSLLTVLAAEGEAMLVTVAATRGSAPREAATRMIVTPGALHGTIGGGHLEFEAVRIAREAMRECTVGAWLVRFPLAASLGQCCGGVATLMFQRVGARDAWPNALRQAIDEDGEAAIAVAIGSNTPCVVARAARCADAGSHSRAQSALRDAFSSTHPATRLVDENDCSWYIERMARPDFHIVVFGNGHVGRALVQVLSTLPCDVTWVDAREHDFPASVPGNASIVASDTPEDAIDDASTGSHFLVMTHSHTLDFDLTSRILARGDFRYLGLIGSASKRAQFERRLRARGFGADALKRMTCPIGSGATFPAIRSKEPGAIAIAVAAEILQLQEAICSAATGHRARA